MEDRLMSEFDFKKAFVRLIERTKDPIAAIKLQEAYKYANLVGKMLAYTTNIEAVTAYRDVLLSGWDDDEINKVCAKPEFLIAVAGIFAQALVEYAVATHNGAKDAKVD